MVNSGREEGGWQEQLRYVDNYAYKLHTEERTWTEAEAECQKEGGHLASVASKEVNEELHRLAGTYRNSVLLGGKQKSGVWSWSDNSSWGYTNWGYNGSECYIRLGWSSGT